MKSTRLITLGVAICASLVLAMPQAAAQSVNAAEEIAAAVRLIERECEADLPTAGEAAFLALERLPDGKHKFVRPNGGDSTEALIDALTSAVVDAPRDQHRLRIVASLDALLKDIDPEGGVMDGRYPEKSASIGVELKKGQVYPLVTEVFEATPASHAGIAPGDELRQVDGVSLGGLSLKDAIERLRGSPNSIVSVVVKRGAAAPFALEMKRAVILRQMCCAVTSRSIGRVGLIVVPDIHDDTVSAVQSAVEALRLEASRGFIIDLRDNTGGTLDAVERLTDLFLGRQEIGAIEPSAPCGLNMASDKRTLRARDGDIASGAPLILLTNKGTSSGAEIFVSALRRSDRARVVGGKTLGHVSIATLVPVRGGALGVKLTTHKFKPSAGPSFDGAGIAPDVETADTTDAALHAALKLLGE